MHTTWTGAPSDGLTLEVHFGTARQRRGAQQSSRRFHEYAQFRWHIRHGQTRQPEVELGGTDILVGIESVIATELHADHDHASENGVQTINPGGRLSVYGSSGRYSRIWNHRPITEQGS